MVEKIRWSPRSVTHLENICAFIAKDSTLYASLFAQKILALVKSLPQFPDSGRVVPEYKDHNLREKIFGNYRIVYRKRKSIIE